jgi:hypothetical protein
MPCATSPSVSSTRRFLTPLACVLQGVSTCMPSVTWCGRPWGPRTSCFARPWSIWNRCSNGWSSAAIAKTLPRAGSAGRCMRSPTTRSLLRRKQSSCCKPCSPPGRIRPFSPSPMPCGLLRSSPRNIKRCAPNRASYASPSMKACAGIRPHGWRAASPPARSMSADLPFPRDSGSDSCSPPRTWPNPDAYDLGRDLRKQVGWGYGVHACVGRVLAQLEAQALLGEFARRVSRIEIAGDPVPWMTTIGHGPARLPIRLYGD